MRKKIIVIGAGIAGLTAAIKLAQSDFDVTLFEARETPGGLASSIRFEDFKFEGGPYILLDRPGLDWVFHSLGLSLDQEIALLPVDPVYEIVRDHGAPLRFYRDHERTADEIDKQWQGSGRTYTKFVCQMHRRYLTLSSVLRERPGMRTLLKYAGWRQLPFLMRSLKAILESSKLPAEIQSAIAVWTRIAGQEPSAASSPMALIPALFHFCGAFYPKDGIAKIPEVLAKTAAACGAQFRYGTKVRKILTENRAVRGVETAEGERISSDAVISNAHGVGTYLTLFDDLPIQATRYLKVLPLQSPGIAVYLAIQTSQRGCYLQFHNCLTEDSSARVPYLFVQPYQLQHSNAEWHPARLVMPLAQEISQQGKEMQEASMRQLLDEEGWKQHVSQYRVLEVRIPASWGNEFTLYKNSMNPVMTAKFMRAGRLSHRSPWIRNLYLAGSSTHPGQWISFCAISGILSANCVIEDHS